MNKEKRTAIFNKLKQENPSPTTELTYNSTFELLIAVILSAQATDISVNKATGPLFRVASTPKAIAELGEIQLKKFIKTIGLFNSKAKNIIKTCKMLVNQHQSQVPNNRADLEALPGVGRKTANVVLNTAFGHQSIAVDTHIFRVANRTKIACGSTPRQVEDRLMRLVPQEFLLDAHHWLILLGRYTCKARKPECWHCPIKKWCEYANKNLERC